MNINDNLIQLAETKSLIKDAIISKGGSVDDTTPFRDYAQAITDLPSGGGTGISYRLPTVEKDGYACEIRGTAINFDNVTQVILSKLSNPSVDTGATIIVPDSVDFGSGDTYEIYLDYINYTTDITDMATFGFRNEASDSILWLDGYQKYFRLVHRTPEETQELRMANDTFSWLVHRMYKYVISGTNIKFYVKSPDETEYQLQNSQNFTRNTLVYKYLCFGRSYNGGIYTRPSVYYLPNCYITKNGEVLYRTVVLDQGG